MTAKKKKSARPETTVASPAKSVLEELRGLSKTFDAVVASYASRIRRELTEVTTKVERLAHSAAVERDSPRHKELEFSADQLRDLRDMITLLRTSEVRPEKGRRKDLKKLDTLVGDLHLLIERWPCER